MASSDRPYWIVALVLLSLAALGASVIVWTVLRGVEQAS